MPNGKTIGKHLVKGITISPQVLRQLVKLSKLLDQKL